MTRDLLVAVDGGNSKTDVALVTTDGGVAATVRGPGSNPHATGVDGALDVIEALIEEAWRQAAEDPVAPRPTLPAGAFLLAGADQPDEVSGLEEAICSRGWVASALVGNDTLALLWAGSPSGFGAAVVVGAGVNGVGRAESGAEAHFGSLGSITGDWGGGGGIGLAALGAAVRSEEGRADDTALRAMIAGHFGQPSALRVALAIHRGQLAEQRLDELAPLVFVAANAGDAPALAIVDRQADEVVGFAVAALRRTRQERDAVTVVIGGSVVAAAPARLVDRVRAGVAAAAPRAELVVWRGRPVAGAAVAVLRRAGATEAALVRARAELAAERPAGRRDSPP